MKKLNKKTIIMIGAIIAVLVASPMLYFLGSLIFESVFNKPEEPIITKANFPFELVYEYQDEENTIEGTIVCEYEDTDFAVDGGSYRQYNIYIDGVDNDGQYIIDEQKNVIIEIPLVGDYYMGDKSISADSHLPILIYSDDSTGTHYYENKEISVIDLRIISWKSTPPLEDNFK